MSVLRILEIPDPALRKRAKKVRQINDVVKRLAYDMVDTMREASGIGLAANQVGVFQRVIVIQLPDEDEASIYINPEILHRDGEREVEEGCLSIPGFRALVTRSVYVRFRSLDLSSKTVKIKADGMLAHAMEHEVDHLNGILYIDHLDSHEKLIPITDDLNDETGEDINEEDSSNINTLTAHHDHRSVTIPNQNEDVPASLKVR